MIAMSSRSFSSVVPRQSANVADGPTSVGLDELIKGGRPLLAKYAPSLLEFLLVNLTSGEALPQDV